MSCPLMDSLVPLVPLAHGVSYGKIKSEKWTFYWGMGYFGCISVSSSNYFLTVHNISLLHRYDFKRGFNVKNGYKKVCLAQMVVHSYSLWLHVIVSFITENKPAPMWHSPVISSISRTCFLQYLDPKHSALAARLFECCALRAGVVFASAPGHSCLWCHHFIKIAENFDAVCAHSTLDSCYLWGLKVGTPKCIKSSKHRTYQYCSLQAAQVLCTYVRPTRWF